VPGIDEIIKEIENAQIEEKIFPLIPSTWIEEFRYLVENEFISRIKREGKIQFVTSEEINEYYNDDIYSPIDGEIMRGCDHLAAYIEASLSIAHGITSKYLKEGLDSLKERYENKYIASIDFGKMFDYFKQ